jgi:nucleotide-binding universal stress UspA family protein
VEFRKVVLAVDGSEESSKAAELAEAIVGKFRSDVLVVHIREFVYSGASAWSPEWTPDLEAFMAEFVRRVVAQGLRGSSEVLDGVKGQAGKAIADAAAKMGADLIVMGSKGRSRLAGAVLGSVAGGVVHNASCPVLVAR